MPVQSPQCADLFYFSSKIGDRHEPVALGGFPGRSLEQACCAHAAADAHGDDGEAAAAAAELVEGSGGELGARAAEGVAQGDGAAVDVELFVGDFERALHVDRLARKGLVELDDIDVR